MKNTIIHKYKGFTLLELLVVIAAIVLIISILMPATSRAKRQAQSMACRSNLKQWGYYFMMYTDEHDGFFHPGRGFKPWYTALKPYYRDSTELLLCPRAKDPYKSIWDGDTTFATWGPKGFGGTYGSYGINAWVANPPDYEPAFEYKRKKNWRTPRVDGGNNIPLLADCWWPEGWAEHFDTVPPYSGYFEAVTYNDMGHFCINRHDGFINMLFLDYSVRKVGLKELWKLKWHRKYPLNADPPVWPDWMKKFK